METVYLITGVSGFLGGTVARKLAAANKTVVALKLPEDRSAEVHEIQYVYGDVSRPETLGPFFDHSAGRQDHPDPLRGDRLHRFQR